MILYSYLMTLIRTQKLHLIYGVAIVSLLTIMHALFSKQASVVTQTKTEMRTLVQYVDRKVLIHDNVVTNRVIETKKPDGTVITEKESITDLSSVGSNTLKSSQEAVKVSEETATNFLSKYTLTVLYPLPRNEILNPSFEPKNLQVIIGRRVLDTSLLLNVGINFGVNTLFLGVTYGL